MQRPDDPEVLADLRLRDASERDRTRSSPVHCECGHHVRDHHGTSGVCMAPIGEGEYCSCEQYSRGGGPIWSPPAIVERWPCTGCNALVEMTADAIELHAKFSDRLVRRGERPLVKRIPCASCKAREDQDELARRRPHEQLALDNRRRNTR